MWIADNWKDYEVIDTSAGEKLERWGDYLLVRKKARTIIGQWSDNVFFPSILFPLLCLTGR